jgi:hypothetical protein
LLFSGFMSCVEMRNLIFGEADRWRKILAEQGA